MRSSSRILHRTDAIVHRSRHTVRRLRLALRPSQDADGSAYAQELILAGKWNNGFRVPTKD